MNSLPTELILDMLEKFQETEGTKKMITDFRSISKRYRELVDYVLVKGISSRKYDIILVLQIHKNMPSLRKSTTHYLNNYQISEVDNKKLYLFFNVVGYNYRDNIIDEFKKTFGKYFNSVVCCRNGMEV